MIYYYFRHNSTIFLVLILYYLYGDNMIEDLPKCLSSNEIMYYFKKYNETGNEEYREKLILHNLRLVGKIVFNDFCNSKYDKDDLFSIGVEGLIKAVDNYDVKKGYSFSTFASVCIRNSILMYFRCERKYFNDVSINSFVYKKDGKEINFDEYFTDGKCFEDEVCDENFFDFVIGIIENLNDLERFVIINHLGLGTERLGQKEISMKLGLSQSYISRLEKKIYTKLKIELMNKDSELILDK